MILIRLLALGLWVLAALSLGGDLWKLSQTGEFEARGLGRRWADVDTETLTLLQNTVERYISPDLWNPGIVTVLSWPAWAVLGALALAFSIISRGKR